MVYPVHLLYAVLVAKDERRDEAMRELGIDKGRLRELARSEVIFQEEANAVCGRRLRPHWN
jgi:hypothetical protein